MKESPEKVNIQSKAQNFPKLRKHEFTDTKNTQTISETENTLGRILIADKTSQEKISHREDLVIEITHDET